MLICKLALCIHACCTRHVSRTHTLFTIQMFDYNFGAFQLNYNAEFVDNK